MGNRDRVSEIVSSESDGRWEMSTVVSPWLMGARYMTPHSIVLPGHDLDLDQDQPVLRHDPVPLARRTWSPCAFFAHKVGSNAASGAAAGRKTLLAVELDN